MSEYGGTCDEPHHIKMAALTRQRSRSLPRLPSTKNNDKQRQKKTQPQQQQKPKKLQTADKKLLNVTITILSVSGVQVVNDTNNKSSYFTRSSKSSTNEQTDNSTNQQTASSGSSRSRSRSRGRSRSLSRPRSLVRCLSRGRSSAALNSTTNRGGRSSQRKVKIAPLQDPNATTLVTTFQRTSITKKGGPNKVVSHVSSLPLDLSNENINSSANNNKNEVICWGDQTQSSFTFQRYFPYETTASTSTSPSSNNTNNKNTTQRYVPQLCSIQLSLSHQGKMISLGNANVYISGDESGVSTMNVPILDNKSSSSVSSSSSIKMKRIKGSSDGTSLKYGTHLPMLRVVINVSDPSSAMGRISKALSFEDSSNKNKVQQQSSFFDCLCCMG